MKKKPAESILELVPMFYTLGVMNAAVGIATKGLGAVFAIDMKKTSLEFKMMGIVQVEVIDKHKKTIIEYHPLKGIKKYLDKFIKKNPKYTYEKENYCEVITGRYILTRVYRKYNKKITREDYEDCCPECGSPYY